MLDIGIQGAISRRWLCVRRERKKERKKERKRERKKNFVLSFFQTSFLWSHLCEAFWLFLKLPPFGKLFISYFWDQSHKRLFELQSVWPDVAIKSSTIFSKSCPKSMLISVTFSKWPKIVAKHLGYFCKELCSKELSKIAQSGHTD